MHLEGNNVLRNLLAVSWAQLLSVKPIEQIKTKPCKAGASHFSRKALHPLCKFAGNERVHPVQRGQRCYRAPSICETHKSNSIWGSLCQCISLYSAGIKITKRWKHWRSSKELWKGNCMRKEKDSVGWCNGKIVERKNKYQNQKMQAETEKVKSEPWQSNKFTVNSLWGRQLPLSAHKHTTAEQLQKAQQRSFRNAPHLRKPFLI